MRRRDIADIFLGTGLGARAYAIIEQGMISRIIEAKPEELRIFLEEAAGVSKYRERRRETELRLADTRENLLRVEDIRLELDKQLEHLREQAEVATAVSQSAGSNCTPRRICCGCRRSAKPAMRASAARAISRSSASSSKPKPRACAKSSASWRNCASSHHAAGEAVHAAQGSLYETNAEFSRLQQQIQHVRENRRRIESQLAALRSQLEQGETPVARRSMRAATSGSRNSSARSSSADTCQAALAAEAARLPVAEQAFRASQEQRDALQQAVTENAQALQLEQTRREHALKILAQLAQREQRLREEQSALAPPR